jgi:hypothetical protein
MVVVILIQSTMVLVQHPFGWVYNGNIILWNQCFIRDKIVNYIPPGTNTQPSTSTLKPDFQQQTIKQHCMLLCERKRRVLGNYEIHFFVVMDRMTKCNTRSSYL